MAFYIPLVYKNKIDFKKAIKLILRKKNLSQYVLSYLQKLIP